MSTVPWPCWIETTKRVPHDDRWVLIYEPEPVSWVTMAYFEHGEWTDGGVLRNVTHWMELPKPPGNSDE